MKLYRDADHYDSLTDALAEDFTTREFERPSLYFTASAFVRAMRPTVAATPPPPPVTSPPARTSLPASVAVTPDLPSEPRTS
jgi:hypothetical protein